MLIEFHVLQNHAPSNLNRDESGSPKESVFGGHKRARISSQCLKRSIRRSPLFRQELAGHLATRTRRLPELMRERFKSEGFDEEIAGIAAQKASGFGTAKGDEQKSKDGKYATAQTMFLTTHDIEAVATILLNAAREAGNAKKFAALKAADLQALAQQRGFRPVTVDVALFGRMTTSEAFRDVEAAMQVAHALSTHKVDHEFDYFTAVDDLKNTTEESEEDAGADMLGDVEYNSACYYKYFSLDVDGLIANLTGESAHRKDIPDDAKQAARELAARTVDAFVRAMTMTTPTGKQNSFAAHQLPAAILVEVRPYPTPVSYANAFVDPARPGRDGDLVQTSLKKFGTHIQALTGGFNLRSDARLLLAPEHNDFEIADVTRVTSLEDLCQQVRAAIENDNRQANGNGGGNG
ncbi:MAG: type I-E CRISPR-associated protein Cas7/Cse4/CasC [Abitibacteriaceae bacterium]|nr:type I-E CRISPR-associated protein Cas7/Cse4/CasC [Abditibacteriaceae bacterium]